MAQRVQVLLTDDLDGGNADETIQFALDGSAYELDLSKKNADKLRKALAPFVAVARKQARSASHRPTRRRPAIGDVDPRAVRAWAASNGIAMSARGRVSEAIVAQYRAAGH
jgi:hypothetical protein